MFLMLYGRLWFKLPIYARPAYLKGFLVPTFQAKSGGGGQKQNIKPFYCAFVTGPLTFLAPKPS